MDSILEQNFVVHDSFQLIFANCLALANFYAKFLLVFKFYTSSSFLVCKLVSICTPQKTEGTLPVFNFVQVI